jgi:hypothetical protein
MRPKKFSKSGYSHETSPVEDVLLAKEAKTLEDSESSGLRTHTYEHGGLPKLPADVASLMRRLTKPGRPRK